MSVTHYQFTQRHVWEDVDLHVQNLYGIIWVRVIQRVKQERTILQTITRRNAKWIGHILHRNYPLIRVIEGEIGGRLEWTGIQGRRRKQLLDGLNELEKGNNKSHFVENSLWKSCWICRETDSRMNGECECDVRQSQMLHIIVQCIFYTSVQLHSTHRHNMIPTIDLTIISFF